MVLVNGRTPLPQDETNRLLTDLMARSRRLAGIDELRSVQVLDIANMVESLDATRAAAPAGAAPGAAGSAALKMPDPLLPAEDMINDTRFTICRILAIETGEPAKAPPPGKP